MQINAEEENSQLHFNLMKLKFPDDEIRRFKDIRVNILKKHIRSGEKDMAQRLLNEINKELSNSSDRLVASETFQSPGLRIGRTMEKPNTLGLEPVNVRGNVPKGSCMELDGMCRQNFPSHSEEVCDPLSIFCELMKFSISI